VEKKGRGRRVKRSMRKKECVYTGEKKKERGYLLRVCRKLRYRGGGENLYREKEEKVF